MLAAPALRRSPRDHAAGIARPEGKSSKPAAREIGARGKSYDGPLTAGAHQRDFEGRRGEHLRAGAHSEASVTLRAPAACPSPAGGDERGARNGEAFAPIRLRRTFQRRPGSTSSRPGRSVPTREAARHRSAFEGNNV